MFTKLTNKRYYVEWVRASSHPLTAECHHVPPSTRGLTTESHPTAVAFLRDRTEKSHQNIIDDPKRNRDIKLKMIMDLFTNFGNRQLGEKLQPKPHAQRINGARSCLHQYGNLAQKYGINGRPFRNCIFHFRKTKPFGKQVAL